MFKLGKKNIRNALVTLLVITIALSGCQWDPPHSNPWDPGNSIPSLAIQVLSRGFVNQVPVAGATVQIQALNLIATTDSTGMAFFDEVKTGTWWVSAVRQGEEIPIYALDSILVTVNPASQTTTSVRLDALPYFVYAKVNVLSFQEGNTEVLVKKIRLKAKVIDPDGDIDLNRVEWRFKDFVDTLNYNQHSDSAFHEIEILSSDFPYPLGQAQLDDFYFEAFDQIGNSTIITARIQRIISALPFSIRQSGPEVIEWWFIWREVFDNVTDFNHLLRIYSNPFQPEIVYDSLIVRESSNFVVHHISKPLAPASYFFYIWVIDTEGNFIRTSAQPLIITENSILEVNNQKSLFRLK